MGLIFKGRPRCANHPSGKENLLSKQQDWLFNSRHEEKSPFSAIALLYLVKGALRDDYGPMY